MFTAREQALCGLPRRLFDVMNQAGVGLRVRMHEMMN